ncbi:hypothetical protein J2T12_000882 [Paenibacillus anaericanus]|nr:hypothetical protein [Paenibacillus anaericanus]
MQKNKEGQTDVEILGLVTQARRYEAVVDEVSSLC